MTTVGDIGISPVLLQAITHLSGSSSTRVKQDQTDLSNSNSVSTSAYIPAVKTIKVGNTEFVVREAQSPSFQVTPKERTVLVIRKVKDENTQSVASASQWISIPGQSIIGQSAGVNELSQNWVSLAKSVYGQKSENENAILQINHPSSQLSFPNRLSIMRNGGLEGMVSVDHDEGVQEIEVETQPFDGLNGRVYSRSIIAQPQQQISDDATSFSPSFDESSTDVGGMMQLNTSQDDDWSPDAKRFHFDDVTNSVYSTGTNTLVYRGNNNSRVQVIQNGNGGNAVDSVMYRPQAQIANAAEPSTSGVFGDPCPVCGDKISGHLIIKFQFL